MRSVELETVRYRTDEIAEASARLLQYLANNTNIAGVREWVLIGTRIKNSVIRLHKAQSVRLIAPGLHLIFSGFPNPSPIIENDKIVFKAKEPHFVLLETGLEVSPLERTYIHYVTSQISQEMEDVFHLRSETNPTTLFFPKTRYAQSVEVFNAALLA